MGWLGSISMRREFWEQAQIPPFTDSIGSLLPFMHEWYAIKIQSSLSLGWLVSFKLKEVSPEISAVAKELSLACVIAMLRANGVTVEDC